jgi:methylated-DNA-[protein]-cysteine S-methyltransferase
MLVEMSARAGTSFAVFDSPIGFCAIAWNSRGVVRFLLPEATRTETEARIRDLCPDAHPARPRRWVAELISRVRRHLGGAHDDFADVPLDTEHVPPFFGKVYEALRKVRPGSMTTYGALGRKVGGSTGAARAVGVAMSKNPFPLIVPCHRVVASNGALQGFSAPGGLATKARLLALEGHRTPEQVSLFEEPPASARGPSGNVANARGPSRARPRMPTPAG